MSSRDYYNILYGNRNDSKATGMGSREILDNETEFNANQFKLFDDFTTDLRISYNPIRNNYHEITRIDSRRRVGDPNDSGVDMENGNPHDDITLSNDADLLENEVMVDPWSSMDSSNSPLTDSGPCASEDCTPSTSSEPPRGPLSASSPLSYDARRVPNPKDTKFSKCIPPKTDKARSRNLTLDLETLEPDSHGRRSHFLEDDFQSSSKSNIECRIPKPHFLDHSPSPDEFDERSDITNPNFLDDEIDGDDNQAQKKSGALPKRPQKPSTSTYSPHEDKPHRTNYRTTLHYGLESAARSSERDKRASQLYRGTWPGERDVWTGHDSASVRSFSSNGSAEGPRPSSNLENKMECVCSLISLLSLSPENNADLSGPLLDMSRSVESCIAMRQAGCIPLLVQLIHSKVPRETRDRAAKALRNIIHTQTDDKSGRREARVWRLLEQVREYCYVLEDLVEARKEGKEVIEDDATKHPSQSVAALMKLSFDEEHRHVVCQLGGLQALAALVSGDQAAHGSRTDDNTCLTMRKYAGMTLTNLTFGDGNNKSLLCSFKDFMLALVEQLESPNDDMRQVTAAVLRNLSWRADTNSKLVLREVGAVKGLTKAAMTCQKEATLKSVLSALWNLTAHCSMNKVALCSVDGALGFLVDMLSYNSPTKTLAIVENAGGIMRNVSSHIAVREDYRQILRERNCLSVLLQHLKSPSLTVVSNSCGTLWNLSARCPQDQQFLWDHGAVPMLRSLIHSKHKMIAMGSGAALKNLLNSKPGKTHIISLDTTARSMNLPALPTLGARKQKALEQELDQNLAETCDNIEPATSPTTSNREEKNLFTATERQIAMNLERHRMTSSSPLMGTLTSQISLSHSAHLASYLSCSNTLLKGAQTSRSATGSAGNVNRSDSKDSVTSTHSDSVFERVMRTGKVPVPTPRNKDLMKNEKGQEAFKTSKQMSKDGTFLRYPVQPPVPPPRSTELRTNYTESGFDVDQDSCDQPIDFSRKYSETKTAEAQAEKPKAETKKYEKKDSSNTYGDYQETDLDQPTDYSLRYAEHQSETGSDSEPAGPSVHEDTIKHFATEGTPYETPIIFSTATSMSDLRVIGKDGKPKTVSSVKENPEVMTHSDEKDTCSIEDPPRHDNDLAATTPQSSSVTEPVPEKRGVFDTKFSSGMISPEKPVNYCDEGTPGYFSRVSSLSSLGEPTEEDCLAKKNAMATINVDPSPPEQSTSITKDKEGSKAVTFATEPVPLLPAQDPASGGLTPALRYVEDTPLMFSRSSSLGSLPDCEQQDDQGSVLSEVSRVTSGCISPSEIPDSPGAPASPRAPPRRSFTAPSTPPQESPGSVCSERVSRFVVEHTPAQFSAATSLSSLTIDNEPKLKKESLPKLPRVQQELPAETISSEQKNALKLENRDTIRPLGISTPLRREPIKDPQTPTEVCRVYFTEDTPAILSKAGSNSNLSALSIESAPAPPDAHDTSDSSNLSDAGDLLEECIQKGIAKVVKNKGPPSETSPINHYCDDVYRSLPAYLRSSTETIKMSHEFARSVRETGTGPSSPTPPLPPKLASRVAPPRPPAIDHAPGVKAESAAAVRRDSLSSLSADSFGSTDREIFEETVQAGANRRAPAARQHRSLDRSDKIAGRRPRGRDPDFERNLASGAYDLKGSSEMRRLERDFAASRSGARRGEHGPASLPSRADDARRLERAGSLSSLSNESFGSTDKEVFERSVRMGMAKTRPRRRRPRGALERMGGEDARDRALLEEVIARGAGEPERPKNVPEPPAEAAAAGEPAPTARPATDSDAPLHRADELPPEDEADEAEPLERSNECLAPRSANTTIESEKDELNRSNESYADAPDASGSEPGSPRPRDTWNDNTCPDDVTFPTISGSVHLAASLRSEPDAGAALPDLLEKSDAPTLPTRPDLTDQLGVSGLQMLDSVPEPSFASLVDEPKYDSILALEIEREAARLAAQLSGGTPWEKAPRTRKKSLPVALMVKRALGAGSDERLDSPVSFLDSVKPPSEMEALDMEGSMVSVASIASEVAERERAPLAFDFEQPVRDFPLCGALPALLHDLDEVNPPSLFDEMAESTLELERPTDDCPSTLLAPADGLSGSERCTPLPSDGGSVDSTPKRRHLTPKERRHAAKDRYQTYTIADPASEADVVLEVEEEFLTWTEPAAEPAEHAPAVEPKPRRRGSAKQRRLEDRARYQTQTVDASSLAPPDPAIESLKRRLAAKKTSKQRRLEDAERFRTRTLSEDIPPSPTFVTKDASFENVETTTGYDSLSSNEPSHQQLPDDADSGHHEDDCELDTARMRTYTRSFRSYLPVTESPAAVDLCVLNNLRNIELTASFRRAPCDSDADEPRPKPKVVKPRRERSPDSADSLDREPDAPKPVRGRKKAPYVSPYRRSAPQPKRPAAPSKPAAAFKAQASAKPAGKPGPARATSANTSPKKSLPNRSPTKAAQPRPTAVPPVATKPLPLERQGTFTKEESSVPAKDLPVPGGKAQAPRQTKSAPPTKANTSPSRLPQFNRPRQPPPKALPNRSPTKTARKTEPTMKNSASNHSLQSNDSGKTITIVSRSSRQGSTSSVNSVQSTSRASAKDVESKISSLWKKVEQAKRQPAKADKRVWIESDKTEQPRLIRSSTFEGQPKAPSPAAKQKSAIGIRVSQIPSLRPKSLPNKQTAPAAKKPTARVFARKPVSGQVAT